MLALVCPALLLLAGCELRHHEGEADFTNAARTSVDIFRNADLQFTLAQGADGNCRVDRDDTFTVRDHATGQVRGAHTVDISGDVLDVHITALIYEDHVDWSTDVETNWQSGT